MDRMLSIALAFAGVMIGSTTAASAQSNGAQTYFRGEVGAVMLGADEGYWWGPGGPPSGDPRITFSLNDAIGVSGGVGIGQDWGHGIRADVFAGLLAGMQVDGTFLSASDNTTVGHATDIHAPVSALSLLANLFVEPMALAGSDSPVQPFLTGGLGVASVTTGEWTRNNASSPQPTRSWEGATQINFAWTAGAGVSIDLNGSNGEGPVLDLTYRYSDYGQASGGTAAIDPPPGSSPTEPFNFPLATHAVTVGLRVPVEN